MRDGAHSDVGRKGERSHVGRGEVVGEGAPCHGFPFLPSQQHYALIEVGHVRLLPVATHTQPKVCARAENKCVVHCSVVSS